ncbi:MAG TPA: arsenate reductase [Solibacterales bacterium]|nr:arsenate reductase [Bryobacterales bacterium]
MTNVQIFGLKSSQETRAAERFFKERRIPIQFVDLKQKPMSPGELKRFTDRFGVQGVLDREGKAFAEAGLGYMKLSDQDWLRRIEGDARLLRLPLVRLGNRLCVGRDDEAWKVIADEAGRQK